MNSIELCDLLPAAFECERGSAAVMQSDVWLRQVTLRRPGVYLIDAGSGRGKSSLCSYIHGDRTDYTGTILVDGADTRSFTVERWCMLRRNELAYLPQEMRLFPELTALENVMLKNRLTDALTQTEITAMAEHLEVDRLLNRPAGLLSIGQQQRVAAIRALSQPFDFIILDEPVSHLDSDNNRAMASLITGEAARRGASVIVTSVGNTLSIDNYNTLRL